MPLGSLADERHDSRFQLDPGGVPDRDVRVEENQRSASQASPIGPTISPMTVTGKEPKKEVDFGPRGTSRATGFPCFVIVIVTPEASTRSISSRQCVLNSVAGIVRPFFLVILSDQYNLLRSNRQRYRASFPFWRVGIALADAIVPVY